MEALYRSIAWHDGVVRMLDQRVLPHETRYCDYRSADEVADAIRSMVIRGAPAIGAAAAWGLALTAHGHRNGDLAVARTELARSAERLRGSRPTAVNLFWAIDRVLAAAAGTAIRDADRLADVVLQAAREIEQADRATNRAIGRHGLDLLPDEVVVIHHCNTGSLATVDYGTALGVIRAAHEHGKKVHVLVDETRPRLQGARLTAWELQQLDIPFEIMVDGAAAHLMRTRRVDCCLVGCDRVAANGDVANKIGTYQLALAAHAHGIPFYVAAPRSTIDLNTATGDAIEIEYRDGDEVACCESVRIAPRGAAICNPAFDITPARYVTALITELGVVRPPYPISIADRLQREE